MAGLNNIAIKEDIRIMKREPPSGISASPEEDSLYIWRAVVFGPNNSLYENGIFQVRVELPKEYPLQPPSVYFLSEMYHPNVWPNGRVCMDILDIGDKCKWKSNYRIRDVLISLQALLAEPNNKSPANWDAWKDFNNHPANTSFHKKVDSIVMKSKASRHKRKTFTPQNITTANNDSSCSIQ